MPGGRLRRAHGAGPRSSAPSNTWPPSSWRAARRTRAPTSSRSARSLRDDHRAEGLRGQDAGESRSARSSSDDPPPITTRGADRAEGARLASSAPAWRRIRTRGFGSMHDLLLQLQWIAGSRVAAELQPTAATVDSRADAGRRPRPAAETRDRWRGALSAVLGHRRSSALGFYAAPRLRTGARRRGAGPVHRSRAGELRVRRAGADRSRCRRTDGTSSSSRRRPGRRCCISDRSRR